MSRVRLSRRRRESQRGRLFGAITTRSAVVVVAVASVMGGSCASLIDATVARADTLQMSSDNLQTGWYPDQPQLTPSAVTGGGFGQIFNTTLSPAGGQVYAQPLGSHGTVLAVTEGDYAYGLNAATGVQVWANNYGPAASPAVNPNTGEVCGDFGAGIGITGTPVIDPSSDTAYFVAARNSGAGGSTQYFMEAANVQTGAAPSNWPSGGVLIQGHADNDVSTVFSGEFQGQRPGLVLVNGVVYVAFGAQCDFVPATGTFTGWLIGVSISSASITTMWAAETGGLNGGGIWQSGGAPVVDSQGNIFVATGNNMAGGVPAPGPGTRPISAYAETVVKLSTSGPTLAPVDWFMPSDAQTLNSGDLDFGSGGPTALPASMGTPQEPNVILQVGKEGLLYALNRDHLGGFQDGPSASDAVPSVVNAGGGVWSKPAVWPGDGGYVYLLTIHTAGLTGGALNAFQRVVSASGAVELQPVGHTAAGSFGFGSGAPSITPNGTASGSSLLWFIHENDSSGVGAQLEAFDPMPANPGANGTLTKVWSSGAFTSQKFAEPGVGDGAIYVGTEDGHLMGFGFTSAPALSGDNVDFAPTTVSQSTTLTAQFTATSPTTVTGFTVSSSGPSGPYYSLGTPSMTLPASLSAGQTITVPVTFTPTAIGSLPGTLTANDSGGTAVLSLSGQGLSATTTLSAVPSSVDFAAQPIGGSTVSQLVTFTNVSGSSVSITGFSAPAMPFSVPTPPATGTLANNASVSFTVDFRPPGSSGNFDHVFGGVATLQTSAGYFGVPEAGSADPPAVLALIPTSLDFGNVQLGTTATLHFSVDNNGGLPLTITASTPPSANGFAATTSLAANTVIGADASIQETVQFTPTSTGLSTSSWKIVGSDNVSGQTLPIQGTGVINVPGAPFVGTATPGDSSATLNWSPPQSSGGGSISAYTVSALDVTTSSHGGQTCSTTGADSCLVSGLTDGDVYSFSVTAANVAGTGPASGASNTVTPRADATATAVLTPNATLVATQSIHSPNGQFRLSMQGDGNLVLYDGATPAWATGTSGVGNYAVMQGDGNLVLYSAANSALWASNTSGNAGADLTLSDAGVLGVDSGTTVIWAATAVLAPNATLVATQSIRSPNGQFRLSMQGDGNLVLYDGATPAWATGTSGVGNYAVMQGDGNLVLYSAANSALWASNTSGNAGADLTLSDAGVLGVDSGTTVIWATTAVLTPNATLVATQSIHSPNGQFRLSMQGDGNLVLYSAANSALWASNTSGNAGADLTLSDAGVLGVDSGTTVIWATTAVLTPNATLV